MPQDTSLMLLPGPRHVALGNDRVASHGGPSRREDTSLPPEGYRISISSNGEVVVESRDPAGAFYAERTLEQLAQLHPAGALPVGSIEDWPDLAVRGVMLDISRCRIPTMASLRYLVDRLASWKINHLELYMEHSFAYAGHQEVWEEADPITPDELAELAAYCRARHIDLVPNQNTFGHMERWLIHSRYAPLGISRGVVTNPLGLPVAASTIDPALPGSRQLVADLLTQLGAALGGTRFHVGLDEPWDLPSSRAGEWASWAHELRNLDALDGRQMLVWGDMLGAHPELIPALPGETLVCEWGYDAGHPFVRRGEVLAEFGVPHWHCPGTSSWLSLVGRATNAVENCREAVAAAARTGAGGVLVTDWGDFGHHQARVVSDVGMAAGAAFAWCEQSNRDLDAPEIAARLDLHAYRDTTGGIGGALVLLGDLHRALPFQAPNMSALTLHLYLPQLAFGSGFTTGVGLEHLDAVEDGLTRALSALAAAMPHTEHGRLAATELATSARLLRLARHDAGARLAHGGTISSVPDKERLLLDEELRDILPTYRRDWLARERTGGLEESCGWLTHLADCYRQGSASPDWAGPLVELARRKGQE